MLKTAFWIGLLMQVAGVDFPAFVDIADVAHVTVKNVTEDPGRADSILEANGNGAAFFDYDSDGDQDLLIMTGSTRRKFRAGGNSFATLYRNDEGTFTNVTVQAGLRGRGWGMGVCVADYDNDGNEDMYLTAYGPNVLYRNRGDGTFEDISVPAGVADDRWSTNCAFGDYDRDGYVDLYVSNYLRADVNVPRAGAKPGCRYMSLEVFCGPRGLRGQPDRLYRNKGDGTFVDVTQEAGIKDPNYYGFGVVFSDLDNDGWPDIYVANDSVPNLLFRNNQDGTFSEVGLQSGTSVSDNGVSQAGMGIAIGDYDNNGYEDLFVTNFAEDSNTLYANMGDMLFFDVSSPAGIRTASFLYLGWGTGLVDLDNDGFKDLFVANGHVYPKVDSLDNNQHFFQPKQIFRNLGEGRFQDITSSLKGDLTQPSSSRGAAFGDYDNDGDIDIVVINVNDRPNLYRNDGGNRKHWITLRLSGTRSNRDAIGARVELRAGEITQIREVRSGSSYLSNNDVRVHFGLGDNTSIDYVRIRWPSGLTEEVSGMKVNTFVDVIEGSGVPVETQ